MIVRNLMKKIIFLKYNQFNYCSVTGHLWNGGERHKENRVHFGVLIYSLFEFIFSFIVYKCLEKLMKISYDPYKPILAYFNKNLWKNL